MAEKRMVLVGPARCGKSHRLLAHYRAALSASRPTGHIGRTRWIAPTARAAAMVRERLLTDGFEGCLAPGVTTFVGLADEVLAATPDPPRQLSRPAERAILRRVVQSAIDAGKLVTLADAARRPSFIDLLGDHVHELQRRDIRPADLAPAVPRRAADRTQHEELALLYADYDRTLASHRLCDSERRLAAARDALAGEKRPRILPGLELVVVDGFTDFTAVQHDLLHELARRSRQLWISLPDDGERGDLFAKSRTTLAELRCRHPDLEVEQMPARPSPWPAMDHVARNLFRHPHDMTPPSAEALDSRTAIEFIESAGAQDEVVQIARAIKRQLLDGTARPGDLVVVFRHLHEAAPRIREVFDEFGIPYSLEAGLPLATSGLLRTLLDLLRLDADDWPFHGICAVATNNLLTTMSRSQRAAAEWLIRDLQIVQGRDPLLESVERLAREPAPRDENSATGNDADRHPREDSHRDRRRRAAAAALPLLKELADALAQLPETATLEGWVNALAQLGSRLGLTTGTEGPTDDHRAWQSVVDLLASVARVSAWLDETPPQLRRRDVLDVLSDIVKRERFRRPHDEVGRVRILAAATARTVEARHVYLAGMSEQAFPAPERTGRFYSDADYAAMARAKSPTSADAPPTQRAHDEMLLFYEVATRATERLTICYPALDEKAQSLPPSPYVAELERTFAAHPLPRRRATRPSPLPPDAPPLSRSDWRILAVAQALGSPPQPAPLAALLADPASALVSQSLDGALRIIAERGRRDDFTAAEGILKSAGVRKRLAQRFGQEHLWSPSQFEKYARCPFHFYLDEVLRLEPLGELVLETDFRRRGTLFHQALAEFHRTRPELYGEAVPGNTAAEQQFARELANVVDALRRATSYTGLEAALAELDRRIIEEWAPRYYGQLADYRGQKWPELDESLRPAHFEWRFGPPRYDESESEDQQSKSEPFVLDLRTEKIRITGRIDRIDVGRRGDKTVFNVIDYKSGNRPSLAAEKILTGERLQPVLYVMAAQALLFGEDRATPLWAGYWSMRKGVTVNARYSLHCSADGDETTENWEQLKAAVVERIRGIVEAVRDGAFPVASRDDQCTGRCEFATVCRIAQVRSLEKDKQLLGDDAEAAPPGEQ